ncbi:MAG: TIGR02757 family protein [Bacteroidales bacterium]|nr:TIGR02757 family protein [Bacteroidales bacterium]
MEIPELKFLLDEKTNLYNRPEFITGDPVSIPRSFTFREDIEISGFMAATIAWGQRTTIVRNGFRLMEMMGNTPYDFVMNAGPSDLKRVSGFVHRTFNGDDCLFFIESLRNIYLNHGGPEAVFRAGIRQDEPDVYRAICHFRQVFLESPHLDRSAKHLANPAAGSTAKRINMFLRWMVRKDDQGVDFGLWNSISPSLLCCPLDVHSGNTARKLGLLKRKQNDWKAVVELTNNLRMFDPDDPARYDFALFGMGVFNVKR